VVRFYGQNVIEFIQTQQNGSDQGSFTETEGANRSFLDEAFCNLVALRFERSLEVYYRHLPLYEDTLK